MKRTNKWRSIRSAPKDDTLIDIWSTSMGRVVDQRLVVLSRGNRFYEHSDQY